MWPIPATSPPFRPSCHRCGTPFADPTGPTCTQCFESSRQRLAAWRPRRVRVRLRTLLLLIAACGVAMGWGISARRHRLADDSHQVYTHEDMAQY